MPRLYLDDERARQRAAIGLFHPGRNGSVGVLANLFPAAVAACNRIPDVRAVRDV